MVRVQGAVVSLGSRQQEAGARHQQPAITQYSHISASTLLYPEMINIILTKYGVKSFSRAVVTAAESLSVRRLKYFCSTFIKYFPLLPRSARVSGPGCSGRCSARA